MSTPSFTILFCINLLLSYAVSLSNADYNKKTTTYDVVGFGECADCKENNFKTSQAFTGLHVSIDCKLKSGEMKRIAEGELDNEGKFTVPIHSKHIFDPNYSECYAQLHSAAAIPCPADEGLEASKIVFKSKTADDEHVVFGPAKKVRFSTPLCTSEFLWPHYKYPPIPKTLPWKKKKKLPLYYKPKPKSSEIPTPLVKPLPPPVSVCEPKPKLKPVVKPLEPKPKPSVKPSVPMDKPKPIVPVDKPKPAAKPILKPFPEIPPKSFDKPEFGYFPPMPPHA